MNILGRIAGQSQDTDLHDLKQKAGLLQQRSDFLLHTIGVMLHFLKSFALDIQEIDSEKYKDQIEELSERYKSDEPLKRIELQFEQQKEEISAFIDRQRSYVMDREKELRDIIDLLTRAIANLNVENRDFYQRVYDQGEKMIEISALDDIKKIKNALKIEVDQMWNIVNLKKEQEKRQIELLAGQVHSLQHELVKAQEQSMTDGLTGIYNRRALDDYLDGRIHRNLGRTEDFCLLMIDIDDFKRINDKHGHLIGDRVLVALTQKCRGNIRNEDYLARYGGEEFTIVLEGAAFRNALKKARQICTTISAVRYATNENQSDDYLCMTVSIGVTQYKKGDTVYDLIARADQALLEAKRKGKNCVVGKKP